MQSNILRYYINNYGNWGIISIRCWIHKRHSIPHPNGRDMGWGVFCEYLWENWPCYNGTALYSTNPKTIYCSVRKQWASCEHMHFNHYDIISSFLHGSYVGNMHLQTISLGWWYRHCSVKMVNHNCKMIKHSWLEWHVMRDENNLVLLFNLSQVQMCLSSAWHH